VSEATAAQWHIGRHVASRSFPRTRGGRRRTGHRDLKRETLQDLLPKRILKSMRLSVS